MTENVQDMPLEDENLDAKAPQKAEEENEAEAWKAKALLLAADMENLRKRTAKELDEARKYAVVNFARDMLTVQDNMARALEAANQENADLKTLKEGVNMVALQLTKTFEKFGVEKVKAVGEKMNPEFHQVMAEIEDEKAEAGTVVQEMQAGYTLNGRLLRPAMVATAK